MTASVGAPPALVTSLGQLAILLQVQRVRLLPVDVLAPQLDLLHLGARASGGHGDRVPVQAARVLLQQSGDPPRVLVLLVLVAYQLLGQRRVYALN